MPQPKKTAAKRQKVVKPQDEESISRFKLDGKSLEIDMASLTFGEVEELEIYFGKPMGTVDFNSARGTMWLAYLALKREDTNTTLDSVRELKITAFEDEDGSERPTEAPTPETSGSPS